MFRLSGINFSPVMSVAKVAFYSTNAKNLGKEVSNLTSRLNIMEGRTDAVERTQEDDYESFGNEVRNLNDMMSDVSKEITDSEYRMQYQLDDLKKRIDYLEELINKI